VLLTLTGLFVWLLAGVVCSTLLFAGTVTGAILSLLPLFPLLLLLLSILFRDPSAEFPVRLETSPDFDLLLLYSPDLYRSGKSLDEYLAA